MQWQVLSDDTPDSPDEIVRVILQNRDLTSDNEITDFLSPQPLSYLTIQQLSELFESSQLNRAIELVNEAIDADAPIIVHGDYDVDGICATAILWETIYYDLGYENVHPFIPHRVDHGYGLSIESIDSILTHNASRITHHESPLLITVDCGITSQDAVTYAQSQGFSVVITDHHTLPDDPASLPSAEAILHTYDLAGAGIAWVLSQALCDAKTNPPARHSFSDGGTGLEEASQQHNGRLDLVALATIADIQPLTGYNRVLVREGLTQLNEARRVGLSALKQVAKIADRVVGPYEVGWMIAPRLNATGRLETAMDALRLLCTRDPHRALDLARKLNQLNWQRQQMTSRALEQAQSLVSDDSPIIVLSHPDWHEGIIGLIAGKLTEKFYRPSIVIAEGEEVSKASARSISGVNIVEIIKSHQEHLLSAGGHELAAGFSIETTKVSEFKALLSNIKPPRLNEALQSGPQLKIDLRLNPLSINWDLYQSLQALEPHGFGNPRPVFVSEGTTVENTRTVGSDKSHLQLTLNHQQSTIKGIAFGQAPKAEELKLNVGDKIDVVYTIDKDDFRGGESVQVKVKDFRKP